MWTNLLLPMIGEKLIQRLILAIGLQIVKPLMMRIVVSPEIILLQTGGPNLTFRNDNIVWDFKNLSIREINLQAVR
jgi:hypothetical protein